MCLNLVASLLAVGANGSGKSNFFAAIQFVLGDLSGGVLRAEERRSLLHEGAGSHVNSAFVEIYFDNSDGRLPSDAADPKEVVIKRAIGLKKDEYYLDGKHATKTEVASLLESAGLSRHNPHHIVPQGRVNALTTMRDDQRLEMLKEVAGTRTYDQRREESLALLGETTRQKDRIAETLSAIESRLKQLDADKEELRHYRALERQRKVAEYIYHSRELKKARDELQRIEAKREAARGASSESAAAASAAAAAAAAEAVVETAGQLRSTSASLAQSKLAVRAANAAQRAAVEAATKLELSLREATQDEASRGAAEAAAREELAALEAEIGEATAALDALEPSHTAAVEAAEEAAAERASCERELSGLFSKQSSAGRFASRAERDRHLADEAKALRASMAKSEKQAAELARAAAAAADKASAEEREAAAARQQLATLEETHRRAAEAAAEAKAACSAAAKPRDELKAAHSEAQAAKGAAQSAAAAAQQTVQRAMPRATAVAVAAIRRIAEEKRLRGVHGTLLELITANPTFNTAIETIAGMQLFHMVVDTDETATVLLRELQKVGAGRVTFMPLNQLARSLGREPNYPKSSEGAVPMISKLKFNEEYRAAVLHVFQRALVVKDLKVGSELARKYGFECVTLEGDRAGGGGALTGGFIDTRRSRLQAQADMLSTGREAAARAEQADGLRRQLDQASAAYEATRGVLAARDSELHRATAALETQKIECEALDGAVELRGRERGGGRRGGKAGPAQREAALAALRAAAKSDAERLADVEREMGSEFTDGLCEAESARRSELQEGRKQLEKKCVAAERARDKAGAEVGSLESRLSLDLQKRKDELTKTLKGLERRRGPGKRGAGKPKPAARGEAKKWRGEAAAEAEAEAEPSDDEGAEEQDEDAAEEAAQAAVAEAEQELAAAREALAECQATHKRCVAERDAHDESERGLVEQLEGARARLSTEQARQAKETAELDKMLARREKLLNTVAEQEEAQTKLGALPKEAVDAELAASSQSSKALWASIEKLQAELSKLSHVNKKALDQYANFTDQRANLRGRRKEVDEAEGAIRQLIQHLDSKKVAETRELLANVSAHFCAVFAELIHGGAGELVMQRAAEDEGAAGSSSDGAAGGELTGVGIRVRFAGGGDAQTMTQLSGGQKTMVALCLIFAIQRCDPAPFYIFDEIDAALDATHRAALAAMIARQCATLDAAGKPRTPTQFITTTFRPELITAGQHWYGVTHRKKVSSLRLISEAEAHRIVAEDQSRAKQHAGAVASQ